MARLRTRRLISCVESVSVQGDELRVVCRFGTEHVTRGRVDYTWEDRTILVPEYQLHVLVKKALDALRQEVCRAIARVGRLREACGA